MNIHTFPGCLLILAILLAGCQSNPKKTVASSRAYTKLGLAYLNKGNYALAENKLKHALKLQERNADAHHYLAELYRKQRRNLLAREEFERALALDGRNISLWNNYAVFLCSEKHYDEAIKWFLKAANKKAYKSRGEAFENAGMCMLETGDKVRARQYFTYANGIVSSPVALYQIAALDYEDGHYAQTVDNLKRYEGLFQATPRTLLLRIQAEQALQHAALAQQYAARLRQRYPNSPQARQAGELLHLFTGVPVLKDVPATVKLKFEKEKRQDPAKNVTVDAMPETVSMTQRAQQLLSGLGYRSVIPHGRMDVATQKALLKFQQQEWLSQTGKISRALLLHMQLKGMAVVRKPGQELALRNNTHCQFMLNILQGRGTIDAGSCPDDLLPLMRRMMVRRLEKTLGETEYDIHTIDTEKYTFSMPMP